MINEMKKNEKKNDNHLIGKKQPQIKHEKKMKVSMKIKWK